MAQVRQPNKKRGGIGELGALVGLATTIASMGADGGAGAAAGTAAAGGGIGSALGTAAQGLGAAGAIQSLSQKNEVGQLDAAKRRIGTQQTTQTPQPLEELEAARMEISQLPEEQRKQYEPPILAALMKARRGQV